jgi:hypothetical protein
MLKKIKTLLLFLLLIIIFPFSPVSAQSVGIKISPVIIEDLVEPGQVLSKIISVTNQSSDSKKLFVYLRDFKGEGEEGEAKLIIPGSEEGSFLASWITVTNESIDFQPFEEKNIPFTVTIPAETGPGGYYGALVIATEPPKLNMDSEDKGAALAISQQTASLLLLKVKGDIREDADIREFITDKSLYNAPFDIEFTARVQNRSNVHIKPAGFISITNFFDKEIIRLDFNEKGSNILPDSFRKYRNNWQGTKGFGRYKASLVLSYGTATTLGGAGMQSMTSANYFWIIPWKTILLVFVGIIFLLSLFWLLLKLYKNKAIKNAMEQAGIAQVKYVRQLDGPSPVLHIGLIILALLLIIAIILSFAFFLFFA